MPEPLRDKEQALNAQIINDGIGRQDAVDLGNGIYMSKDVSNLYLVTTDDVSVLITTGINYSGERYRYIQWYIDSVQRVINLAPEVLITGHGEPVRGIYAIRTQLTMMRDGAQYLRDRTFEGMNAGRPLWDLMKTIKLPSKLSIPQEHGKVPWIVRSIWEKHMGWFRFESSTELYEVPAQAVLPELIEMAGGPGPFLARAQAHLDKGEALHPLHLSEAIPATAAEHGQALQIQLAAQRAILDAAGRENFSEVRWLESEIIRLEQALETAP